MTHLGRAMAVARQGAEAGCHEALFTLGEAPESRYAEARDWLDTHGYASTVDYLVDTVLNYPTLSEAYKVAALDVSNKMRALDAYGNAV